MDDVQPVHSALYRGQVMHHRLTPRRHRFSYSISAFLFDLSELESMSRQCRWFSLNRFNLFSFYSRDFGDGQHGNLLDYLRELLHREGFETRLKRASLLCYPRMLGYAFNPIAAYFCYDTQDRLFATVYEVSNTFGERHSYLLPAEEGEDGLIRQSVAKAFHVSPFMPMHQHYHFRVRPPGETLQLGIRQQQADATLFTALFHASRRPLTDRQLLACFCQMPLMTLKVVAGIHWEALKLWLKGLKIYRHQAAPAHGLSVKTPQ
ncbi:hypothetical protein FHR99_001486 [Litorivivens lipolytica]|uniref:DUF1365 domain-containing protein n=1 Tax=Litorivivens lipolytica TaxID=1524264 RepID=A0A7W4W4N0_9GAMM|nr:DUF1365 family protein [Litorivivens lipolytica]MBB3047250.1 hypothetical protein [Litorivivens lipolytica]